MKCCICGRMLRNSQSQELGYGPVCYRKKFGISPRMIRRDREASPMDGGKGFNIPGQITIEEYLISVLAK